MNTFQRTIKYIAIGFAIFLTIGILTTIVNVVTSVVYIFNDDEIETIDYSMDFTDVSQLEIAHGLGKLNIRVGSGFRVEAANVSDRFSAKVSNGTLLVDDSNYVRKFLWFNVGSSHTKSVITVYVPGEFITDRVKIDSGLGDISLESFYTEHLIINAGLGDIRGSNLTAKKVDINGGVGSIDFSNVKFTDVDFDNGVGSIAVDGMILGKSVFDGGVGEVNLRISGAREDYAIRVSSGLGNVKVNGKRVKGDYNDTYNAENIINIDGGIGGVEVVFYP